MKTKISKIKSIRSIGIEDTYDIEIDHECHNFLANGIVTHNSHSYCYGYIAYVCMYLKRHYPLQFMCAALQIKKRESSSKFIDECERLGIKVLPPDVNKSEMNYCIEGDAIRMGLGNIKNVGRNCVKITQLRPFGDVFDFINKVGPGPKITESLVYGGALDSLDRGGRPTVARTLMNKQADPDIGELAMKEKEALGFYFQMNPLGSFMKHMEGTIPATAKKTPKQALVGGMILKSRRHEAKTGTMAFLSVLTIDGEMDVLVWPSDYKHESGRISVGNIILANGNKTDKGTYAINGINVLQ